MVKGIKFYAQSNGSRQDIEDALALSANGIVPATEVVPLQSLDNVLNSLKTGQGVGRKVISFS